MNRRMWLFISLLLIGALLLSACAAPMPAAPPAEEAAPAAEGGEAETITVIFPQHEADQSGAFEARVAEFQDETGIQVTLMVPSPNSTLTSPGWFAYCLRKYLVTCLRNSAVPGARPAFGRRVRSKSCSLMTKCCGSCVISMLLSHGRCEFKEVRTSHASVPCISAQQVSNNPVSRSAGGRLRGTAGGWTHGRLSPPSGESV